MRAVLMIVVVMAGCSGGAANQKAEEDSRCVLAKFMEKPDAEATCVADCDANIADACTTLGLMYHQGHLVQQSDPQALTLVDRGCELGDSVGCFHAGTLRTASDDLAVRTTSFQKACDVEPNNLVREDRRDACVQTAAAYLVGSGVDADPIAGGRYAEKACLLGSFEACEGQLPAPPQAASDAPEVDLTFGTVEADGFKLVDLSCRLKGGGMMAGIVVVGLLSKEKAVIDACGAKNDAALAWTAAADAVTQASAEGNEPDVNECLATAIRSINGMPDGPCAATLPVTQ